MAQRGGSVVTYVKYGDAVYSPIISEGEADIILSFEELEAYRYLPYLKKGGTLIVNAQEIDPMPVITGVAQYQNRFVKKLKDKADGVIAVDALRAPKRSRQQQGGQRCAARRFGEKQRYRKEKWLVAIERLCRRGFLDVNLKAFALGYNTI